MNIRYPFISYVAATLITVVSLGSARATVLYEQSPAGSHNTAAVQSSGGGNTAFDNFALADAATVTSISWIGRFSSPGNRFRVGFYESDDQHIPLAAPLTAPIFELTSIATDTHNPLDPRSYSRHYTLDLGAGVSLEADTNYFVSIQNLDFFYWQWQLDNIGFAYVRRPDGSDVLTSGSLFFTLEGELNSGEPTVALAGPPAAAILALGLIGISTTRRRRNRHPNQ